MPSKASRYVLPVMTFAAWVFMLGTFSRTQGNPVSAFIYGSSHELTWPVQNWGMSPSDPQSSERDLLEIPLDSLESEVRRLAAQHGWSATWFRLLLPQAVEMACAVEFSSLTLTQKIEHANLLAFRLSANLNPKSRQALGRVADFQAVHENLISKVEESVMTPLALEAAVDQRLLAIFPKSSASNVKQRDSVVLLGLQLAVLNEVLDGTNPQSTIYVAQDSACPTPWPGMQEHLQPQSPLRLAVR